MAIADMANELVGTLPGLGVLQARTYVNRAWRAIRDSRSWGFLIAEGAVFCPASISTGTIATTQFNATVVCDAAATAALTGLVNPVITLRQIRFAGGPLYNILSTAVVGPFLTLTLDRIIQEASAPAATYLVYRCYVTPPATDFLRFSSVIDTANGVSLTLDKARPWIDAQDPQRQATSQSLYVAWYKADVATGSPIYELWPHPTDGQTFLVTYRRQGLDLAWPTGTLPVGIPEELVVLRALLGQGLTWGAINVGKVPALRNTSPLNVKQAIKDEYRALLASTIRADESSYPQRIIRRGHGLRVGRGAPSLLGADYFQSHGIYW